MTAISGMHSGRFITKLVFLHSLEVFVAIGLIQIAQMNGYGSIWIRNGHLTGEKCDTKSHCFSANLKTVNLFEMTDSQVCLEQKWEPLT